jgi:hypothetical protein
MAIKKSPAVAKISSAAGNDRRGESRATAGRAAFSRLSGPDRGLGTPFALSASSVLPGNFS